MNYKKWFILFFLIVVFHFKNIGKSRSQGIDSIEYRYSIIEGIKNKYIGSLRGSVALFQNAVSINDSSAVAYYEMANIYFMQNDIKTALKFSQKAVNLDPSNLWYKLQLGQLYISDKNFVEATAIFKNLIKLYPGRLEFKYQLANVYIQQGLFFEALKIYDGIEREFGFNDETSFYKHNLFILLKDYREAVAEMHRLIELFPDEAKYLRMLAGTYLLINDTVNSVFYYRKALENSLDDPVSLSGLASIYLAADSIQRFHEMLSVFYLSSIITIQDKVGYYLELSENPEFFIKRRDELKQIFAGFNHSFPSIEAKQVYADFLEKAKYYSEAIEQIQGLIKLEERNHFYWHQLLSLYNYMDQVDSIIEYSNDAILLFPDNPVFYLFNGIGNIQLKNFESAETALYKGLKLINDESKRLKFDFHVYLGDVYFHLDQYDKSDYHFDEALGMDPDNLLVLNNYSYYLSLRETKLAKAKEMSHKTILADSLNSTYLDTYAWVLFKLKDFNLAKLYIEKAFINGGSKNPEILDHYGDILLNLNDIKEAVKFWKEAYYIDSSHNEIYLKIMEYK